MTIKSGVTTTNAGIDLDGIISIVLWATHDGGELLVPCPGTLRASHDRQQKKSRHHDQLDEPHRQESYRAWAPGCVDHVLVNFTLPIPEQYSQSQLRFPKCGSELVLQKRPMPSHDGHSKRGTNARIPTNANRRTPPTRKAIPRPEGRGCSISYLAFRLSCGNTSRNHVQLRHREILPFSQHTGQVIRIAASNGGGCPLQQGQTITGKKISAEIQKMASSDKSGRYPGRLDRSGSTIQPIQVYPPPMYLDGEERIPKRQSGKGCFELPLLPLVIFDAPKLQCRAVWLSARSPIFYVCSRGGNRDFSCAP